ncbi:MAG TPA: cation-transporting P-type ATPase [Paracoccaceae bacterium]|nr:cation-transporting P-type ATPase [Paracoccaceae bacterium]
MNQVVSETNCHAIPAASALKALAATEKGLSQNEAESRLGQYGPNCLPEPPRRSTILRYLSHFHNVLIYVLLGSAAITAGLGHLVDTGVILAVVIANAIIGFVQEGRAEQAMEVIRHLLAPQALVFRQAIVAAALA